MAGTSHSDSQARPASQLKIRVRYGRLSLALLGLLALVATLTGVVLAPFTALTFGWVGVFLAVGVASFASLRMLAVRDRNRKLLAHHEATRQRALNTPAFEDRSNQVITRATSESLDEVFDARPGSARRAPAITVEELRAEALRVAHGYGGVKQPETWELTNVPRPTYVEVREAAAVREATQQLTPEQLPMAEPLPAAEPLRPSKPISLKASEDAKRIASEVSAEDRAAVPSLPAKLAPAAAATDAAATANSTEKTVAPTVAPQATPAASVEQKPAEPATESKTPAEAPAAQAPAAQTPAGTKSRLNLDAVMQRRRA